MRKLEESRKKVTKLEAMVLRLEQKVDEKNGTIYHNRKEAQNKAQHLKRNLHVSKMCVFLYLIALRKAKIAYRLVVLTFI